MTMVGIPGLNLNSLRRRTIRATPNPMDKCTVVSIFPKKIDEIKHTIQPGRFIIEAGSLENPSILVVGSSSWWREIDEEQPLLEIPQSSIVVADSIVKDYCNGLLGFTEDAQPGLFYVPGECSVTQIRTSFVKELNTAAVKQKKWFENLIKITDILWARTNGSPLCVSDDARLAANVLGLTKDWMMDFHAFEQVRCIACGALKNPEFPVCRECKAISDPDKAKKLGIEFAK